MTCEIVEKRIVLYKRHRKIAARKFVVRTISNVEEYTKNQYKKRILLAGDWKLGAVGVIKVQLAAGRIFRGIAPGAQGKPAI